MFHLRRWLLPTRKLLREFRTLGLLPLLFPALQVVRGRGRGSRDAPGIVSWRLPPLPLDLGPAGGVGVLLDYRLLRAGALLLSWRRGKFARSQRISLARSAPRLSLTIPRRTLDDVGNCGRLRRTAPTCYPLVVLDLRIVEHGRIRELVHGRVVFVDRGRLSRSSSRSRSEVESVEGGHRRGRSLLVCNRVAIGGGLLTATALDVCALILGETGLDPRLDTGLAVTALGVPGRGLLPATGHIVSVRVSLPVGKIGVTARGHTLSRVALVTARSHAGDNLLLLPARGQSRTDGWPDEISRRVLRRLSLSLLLFLKCRLQLLLLQEELFFRHFRLLCRILPGSFWSLSGFSSLGAVGGVAGVAAPTAGSWFGCALRLLQLGQSQLVLRLRYLLELEILLLPAAVPGVPGLQQRQVDSRCRRRRRRSSRVGLTDGRRSVTGGGLLHLCFLLVVRRSTTGLPRFFEVMDPVFFRPLLVAPSLEAPQRGPARFCG